MSRWVRGILVGVGWVLGMMAGGGLAGRDDGVGEVVRWEGAGEVDGRYHDGGVRGAVGVHARQVLRANRTQAPEGGEAGWTYNHAPMLAYWEGRFWVNYVSNLVEEHGPPGRTGFLSSADGRDWTGPGVAFPVVRLPEIAPPPRYFGGKELPVLPAGTESVMHQRMGFYVAPNGKLLTSGFYSYCPNVRWGPNRGQGLGRVVREVRKDGSLGPIYFVRYNRHAGWDETNTPFPFYREAAREGAEGAALVAACEALLADKLMTLQWWEDDRGEDGFFTLAIPPDLQISDLTFGPVPQDDVDYIEPKALSIYERKDGATVGVFKSGLAALSRDGGRTWVRGRHSFPEAAAKIWGQATEDGRYALVYDHSATKRNRFPLVAVTGDDGEVFREMLLLHGEVPPMRYRGVNKALGPQYIRGITPGNGDPPGKEMWLTYSVNKEDLWVTRVAVPLTGAVRGPVREDFEGKRHEGELTEWNLYMPQWAPVTVVEDPWQPGNHALQLADEEPYDYARAERIFAEGSRVRVSFRVAAREYGLNGLEVEVQGARGERPLRLWFNRTEMAYDVGGVEEPRTLFAPGQWHRIELEIDCGRGEYTAWLDGKVAAAGLELDGRPETVQRIVFRTGPWRMDVRQSMLGGEPAAPGVWDADLPGADAKTARTLYLVDDVSINPLL